MLIVVFDIGVDLIDLFNLFIGYLCKLFYCNLLVVLYGICVGIIDCVEWEVVVYCVEGVYNGKGCI